MKINIPENLVIEIFDEILLEETSKVNRSEFNMVQFKIGEVEETVKDLKRELNKLENSIPKGLKNLTSGKISSISSDVIKIEKTLQQLRDKINGHKKLIYPTRIEEKKI